MPTDPFGCPNKEQSRRQLWHWMAQHHTASTTNVLFFPGGTSYELEAILSQGFQPGHLFLIEKNAAVKANYSRRMAHRAIQQPPPENFYRMLLSEAAVKLKQRRIHIQAAHLDFCTNCMAGEMFHEIRALLQSGVMSPRSHLAITLLAGREHDIDDLRGLNQSFIAVDHGPWTGSSQPGLTTNDRGRLFRLWNSIGAELRVQHLGRYHNTRTNNPMLWVIFEISPLQDGGGH